MSIGKLSGNPDEVPGGNLAIDYSIVQKVLQHPIQENNNTPSYFMQGKLGQTLAGWATDQSIYLSFIQLFTRAAEARNRIRLMRLRYQNNRVS